MKNALAFLSVLGLSMTSSAQSLLECTPLCKVECGSGQVAICRTKDGQCTTRCLSVPSELKGDDRKAFILSVALDQEVKAEELKQEEFQTIWQANRAEIDGQSVKFK